VRSKTHLLALSTLKINARGAILFRFRNSCAGIASK
jgi:hypothetical protein